MTLDTQTVVIIEKMLFIYLFVNDLISTNSQDNRGCTLAHTNIHTLTHPHTHAHTLSFSHRTHTHTHARTRRHARTPPPTHTETHKHSVTHKVPHTVPHGVTHNVSHTPFRRVSPMYCVTFCFYCVLFCCCDGYNSNKIQNGKKEGRRRRPQSKRWRRQENRRVFFTNPKTRTKM